eukprot:XP_787993.2 PREDICTED: carboxypeptidase B [Strongylocentrotus purpuratus]
MGISHLLGFTCVAVVLYQFGAHGKPHGGKVRYDNFRVIRMVPKSQEELECLNDFIASRHDLDVWKEPSKVGQPVDIMIPPRPADLEDVVYMATYAGIQRSIMIDDVQQLIENESLSQNLPSRSLTEFDKFDYTIYHTFEEIDAWIDDVADQYSNLVSVEAVSSTHEGKRVRGLKIGKPSENPKPIAYIQGGIHAREWVSPATVMFMTYKLLEAYGEDATVTEMFDKLDWYIVPVLNVDGYIYTWTNDRNWRKNRRMAPGNLCVGTDLNRNYDYEWGGQGASPLSCSLKYRGTGPASEIEVVGITDFLTKKNQTANIHLSLDFHSYGQLWLYPWGYTDDTTVLQPDRERQRALGLKAIEAITATHGKTYFVGEVGPYLYPASGGSVDWLYGELGIKYTYAIELRDEDKYGFFLPEKEIQPTTEEIYAAILVVGQQLISEL